MKTALALLLLMAPMYAAETESKAGKDVLATVDAWKQALLKGDAAALGTIYHKDLAYTHSSGRTETKTESIGNATKASAIPKAIESHDLVTHVFGSVATVKGKFDFTNAAGVTSHLDILMVFVKSPQGWQMVARQAVKVT